MINYYINNYLKSGVGKKKKDKICKNIIVVFTVVITLIDAPYWARLPVSALSI